MEDKAFDVFIALRVYQHLAPKQKEAYGEALRVAKKVIIVVDPTYKNSVLPDSKGISYDDFVGFYDGVHPNLYLPTAMGLLYYWDTENKSDINLKNVAYAYKEEPEVKRSILRRAARKIARKIF